MTETHDLDQEYDDALPPLIDGTVQSIIVGWESFKGKKENNEGQQFYKVKFYITGPTNAKSIANKLFSLPNPMETDPVKRREQMEWFKKDMIRLKQKGFKPSIAEGFFNNMVGICPTLKLETKKGKEEPNVYIQSIELDENGEPVRRAVPTTGTKVPF